jgi:hypothetical protein
MPPPPPPARMPPRPHTDAKLAHRAPRVAVMAAISPLPHAPTPLLVASTTQPCPRSPPPHSLGSVTTASPLSQPATSMAPRDLASPQPMVTETGPHNGRSLHPRPFLVHLLRGCQISVAARDGQLLCDNRDDDMMLAKATSLPCTPPARDVHHRRAHPLPP